MKTMPDLRFQSGDVCIVTGWYEFDGYVDGESGPFSDLDDIGIRLDAGHVFPPTASRSRACFWRLKQGNRQSAEALDC